MRDPGEEAVEDGAGDAGLGEELRGGARPGGGGGASFEEEGAMQREKGGGTRHAGGTAAAAWSGRRPWRSGRRGEERGGGC